MKCQAQVPSVFDLPKFDVLTSVNDVAHDMLISACKYLRTTHGRTETEGERRILTTAARFLGTEEVVDLSVHYIRSRVA
jgi:hypothetical protein